MFTMIFLFLLLNIPLLMVDFIHPRCFWRMKQNEDKDGNPGTGCTFFLQSVHWPVEKEYYSDIFNIQMHNENHKYALALAFAIYEINGNPDLLPNMSLIFEFTRDVCDWESQLNSVIQSSLKNHNILPNYICKEFTKCPMALTGLNWTTTLKLHTILNNFISQQFLQVTYGPFHPVLSDNEKFPYLYQMASDDKSLALALVSFIIHFGWNWVGLAISNNDQGIQFLSYLRREMEKGTVCFAFVNMIPVNMHLYMSRAEMYYNQIMTSSTNVVILYGDTDSTLAVSFRMWESLGIEKIWVTNSWWAATLSKKDHTFDNLYGTYAFGQHHGEISGFKNFVQTLNPAKYSDEHLVKLEWMYFNCEVSASKCKTLKNCSSNHSLEWLMVHTFDMAFTGGSYDIYNAVYSFAHALHEMTFQIFDNLPKDNGREHNYSCKKLCSFLRKTSFTNPVGDRVNMNQRHKQKEEYDIFYIWNFPQGLGIKVKIGMFSPYFPNGQQLHLSEDVLEWAKGSAQMPTSACSADCGPGFRKSWKDGMATCCFHCKPCPENEISNETNVDVCARCPDDQYANIEQNRCIPKAVVFLSYEEPLGMALSLISLGFSVFTIVLLGVIVKHHNTPIVKANNRTLTYILLISLIFCFLCPLLFIGHPNSAICILQQITFGVVFTVSVSTVLAKTITVILAFKVTASQRMMKYFLVSRVPNYIIPTFTLFQVILCAVWLGASPPSIDIDAKSEHGHIIIACHKGSVTTFYCVLGYLGTLASGSFTLAFFSRNLPGAFNEAKSITFSMLVFCSVWVTFIPVYHSTKGKIMVAVEIFSTLASSAGMLGCIFVPKCYTVLFRQDQNSLVMIRMKSSSHAHIS
ncbi:vomeronasal type-2 receptor 116-like isoform X2 [Rattus norvegicus]|uniref:Vomeronasal 2 receptor 19 like 1 n=1 Tax=Rattus norvegicus TaxID=10116 RepID=A0A0G2KAL5_RAT|nr:vomeronasal type-2 receptor 116-like isoform X2 [Rattus norvegicus]|eukprot:XP_003748781.2 PREDICTED: vomeronasal type-2 receptor 116-like isoform X2 [Rattus norvegicus]